MDTTQCPAYRVRLFLSVDLVGSTAFKANHNSVAPEKSPNPVWVEQIRHFYQSFPEMLSNEYDRLSKAQNLPAAPEPKIWKTIGDEIVFCCRISSLEHVSLCIGAFTLALRSYGEKLDSLQVALDVKAYCWVATFPAHNVTVSTFMETDLWNERDEVKADESPKDFDFLGKGIDAGFRIGSFCTADRMALSLDLAYLLASSPRSEIIPRPKMYYYGRHPLKGVLSNNPYPLFYIYVERSETRRLVHEYEAHLLSDRRDFAEIDIINFVDHFSKEYGIDLPLVKQCGVTIEEDQLPKSYLKFVASWQGARQEEERRTAGEAKAAEESGQETSDNGDGLKDAEDTIKQLVKSLRWLSDPSP